MNRRLFFQKTCGGVMLLATPLLLSSCNNAKPVRFGIITDLHYSRRERTGTRFYSQTIEKLNAALDVFNVSDLDFIIELGDFKDQDSIPLHENTLTYLNEIEKCFQSFNGPVYHVLGNHDMDSISKEEFLQHTSNYGKANKKTYYSFIWNNFRFITLDANYNEDGSHYDKGNFTWTEAYIPQEQKEWLHKELANKSIPTIIFIHQLLDHFSEIDQALCVNNAAEIIPLLEENGNILAVFQGHHHAGHYSYRNGIHYWTMKGMIEGAFPENNNFAIVEIDAKSTIHINGFKNCESRILQSKLT